jgi:hypothetical protein
MSDVTPNDRSSFWRTTLLSLIGPLVWAVQFALLYVSQLVLCKIGAPHGAVFWFATAVSLLAIAILITLAFSPGLLKHYFNAARRTPQMLNFLLGTTRLLIILSLAGIVWAALAVFFLPECSTGGDTTAPAAVAGRWP